MEETWTDIGFLEGDIVCFNRGEYSHLAIYVGRGRVIHLWSPISSTEFQVRIDTIRYVQSINSTTVNENTNENRAYPECYTVNLDERMLRDHDLVPFVGDDVVRRAMTKLGETEYDYLHYNCEHFVTWARYGLSASPQVLSHSNQVLAGALLGAVVGGVAGFVVGGLISLFTKADALSASVGAAAAASSAPTLTDSTDLDDDIAIEDSHVVSEYESEASSTSSSEASEEERERNTRERINQEERQRLWREIPTERAPEEIAAMTQLDEWIENRRQKAVRASLRQYSDRRHSAIASRLAEDEMQCRICYTNLLRVRALVFPCDHFTCGVCFAAVQENSLGKKCCPYCRLEIDAVDEIHKSTKVKAQGMMEWS